ncbi:MAG: hypothetical protein FJZ79_05160 [Chlorobi bacterium]|nr:hypothetical protein [Chlorobiota bacterium]
MRIRHGRTLQELRSAEKEASMAPERNSPFFFRCNLKQARSEADGVEKGRDGAETDGHPGCAADLCDECVRLVPGNVKQGGQHIDEHYRLT